MRGFTPIIGGDVESNSMKATVAPLIERFRQTSLRWRIGAVALVIAIIAAIFLIPKPEFSEGYFESWGYLGVFSVTFLANATVLLPTPGFLAIIVAAAVLNPFLVGLLGAVGMTLGELSGYFIGRASRALSNQEVDTEPKRWHKWIAASKKLVERWGMLGIVILAAAPNPLFDLAGIAAGAIKMGVAKFLVATFIGRLIRTMALAYGSAYSVGGITDIFD